MSWTDGLADSRPAPLRVVVGPTAAGKSALVLHLAARHPLTIVSADSRQVYRRFDIGTAKPSAAEQAAVPHAGIDLVEPTEAYSAHRWASSVPGWLAASRAAGRTPVIVGGTGFYVRALTQPLAPVPAIDPGRRTALAAWMQQLTTEELGRWCARLDPSRAPLGRTQRLRAVETALLAGVRLSEHFGPPDAAALPPATVHYLVVDPGPALALRLADRLQAMLAAGWLDEVRRLVDTVPSEAPAWKASGYRALRDYVVGQGTRDAMVQRVLVETRQYAKRQRTWFRHQLGDGLVTRVDPQAPGALAQVESWWEALDRMEES